MAYLDEIAFAASVLMQSKQQSENAAFTYVVTQRFRDWGKKWVPHSDECTGVSNDEDGFCLSFENKHLHFKRQNKRWCVSERKDDKPQSFDSHDVAIEQFSAPFAFLEGMAFFSECLDSALLSNLELRTKTEKKLEKRIKEKVDFLINVQHKIRKASACLTDEHVVCLSQRSSVLFDTERKCPPDAPSDCIHPDAARLAFKNKSGCYFLWNDSVIEYVGRANCIGSRLSGHHKLSPDHYVSCVLMPKKESWFAEAYYIWKYRPKLNGESSRAERGGK